MMNDDRLVDIEITLARQEDLIDGLNQTVYRQQKKIDELEALCASLAQHIREMRDAGQQGGLVNERPPHY